MGGKAISKLLRAAPSGAEKIADWKWRPLDDVRQDIGGIGEVPSYITENYGRFMQEQAKRAAAGDIGARDLLKAYGITTSSIGRMSRNITDDLAAGSIRPEGYMAEWLMSPAGKSYLDAGQKGKVDAAAIEDAAKRFTPFGKANVMRDDLTWGVENLAQNTPQIASALTGSPETWRDTVQNMRQIGPAKSGFIASLLGRGDMPTLDARQIKLHTGGSSAEAGKRMRPIGAGDAAVDRLAQRQTDLGFELPSSFAPHYQHLAHHTIWDKVAGEKTTHSDLVRAMQMGGASLGMLGGLAGGSAALAAALREDR